MAFSMTYTCKCAKCGATVAADQEVMANSGWRRIDRQSGTVYDPAAWAWTWVQAADCVCNACAADYDKLRDKLDKAQQEAADALADWLPKAGGSGTEADPYVFTPNVTCELAKFYVEAAGAADTYAYMPADAVAKSYETWADALADMVKF